MIRERMNIDIIIIGVIEARWYGHDCHIHENRVVKENDIVDSIERKNVNILKSLVG